MRTDVLRFPYVFVVVINKPCTQPALYLAGVSVSYAPPSAVQKWLGGLTKQAACHQY